MTRSRGGAANGGTRLGLVLILSISSAWSSDTTRHTQASAERCRESRVITRQLTSRFIDVRSEPFSTSAVGGEGDLTTRETLPVTIYLPECYDGQARFPVLYLLHSHGYNADTWLDPELGDLLAVAGEIGAVVVIPDGGVSYFNDRYRDGARLPAWERFFFEQLIPRIERDFAVRPGRRWRAIAGYSMGGSGAIFLASQRPGYFGTAVSLSGVLNIQRPLWPVIFDEDQERFGIDSRQQWGDPEAQEFFWAGHNPTDLAVNLVRTRLYVTAGDGVAGSPEEAQDVLNNAFETEVKLMADDFVNAAQAAGIEPTYVQSAGGHNWSRTHERFVGAVDWGLFGHVRSDPIQWTYRTVAQHSKAWGLRFDFVAPPESLINFKRDGDQLTGSGAGTVSITAPGRAKPIVTALPFSLMLPK